MLNHNKGTTEEQTLGAKRPARIAIWLSALLPGVGQFIQRRWIRGTLYLIVFVVCLILLFIEVIAPIVTNFFVALDFADGKANRPFICISARKILAWLCIAFTIYVLALIDTINVYGRQCRKWREERARKIGFRRECSHEHCGC